MFLPTLAVLLAGGFCLCLVPAAADGNLITDPSFEITKPKDEAGRVFAKWEGWKFEGDCGFEVGQVGHTGRTSALLACSSAGKIRISQGQELEPGRYRITAYLRGMDIGTGAWNNTTEFMFNDKYFNLSQGGNFGWTKMTFVADLAARVRTGPSFGLWAPGMLWIDDVSMERVGKEVRTTGSPVLGKEEEPIAPPGPLGPGAVRCSRCRYRNMLQWEKCYACGTPLKEHAEETAAAGPARKLITSFENSNPFDGGTVAAVHASDGHKSLRIDQGYVAMREKQNWAGYDLLKVDTYTDGPTPLPVAVEIQDTGTHDYWTRVNYRTVVPAGKSTLILPLQQLYVGEKSRPGRPLILDGITRLVFAGQAPGVPLFIDNIRLERDSAGQKALFDGLYAFDFGTGTSPVMDGFTAIVPTTLYNQGRGYGLKNAKIWRAMDALQPDPLYEDFICIESGGLAVDVPNGKYRVIVNMDSPAGFWGETQIYHERSITAQGKRVVFDTMNLKSFEKKYFQFWDQDDLPGENTFDKYDRAHFSVKTFDVDVSNGHLFLEFHGENWACSVSAVILYPVAKAAEGERFLEWVREKRRFYFDNSFKRVTHQPAGEPLKPGAEDQERGYVAFPRDIMRDLYYNDTPTHDELAAALSAEAFAGQDEPLSLGVIPLKNLGTASVTVSALSGSAGTIPASAIETGYVSYRISRVTMDGGVYTITPRLVLPRNKVALPAGTTRQFWFTVHTPETASPGVYTGHVTITPQQGAATTVPLRFTVRKGALDAVDLPAGPWGGRMGIPWFENDPETAAFGAAMTEKSLKTLRSRGFTMFTGVPYIVWHGFQNGKPSLDFSFADKQMQTARQMGFLAVGSYGAGLQGLNSYYQDLDQMKAAGFTDYSQFIKAVYSTIEQHAREQHWLPVYWSIGDEPTGDDLKRSIENAKAYRAAFPGGPPFFTAATSLHEPDEGGLYFTLAQTLQVPALNTHSEAGVKRLLAQGGAWAFYNSGSRWTFGEYLYKAAKQFQMKFRLAWHWNAVAGDPYYALDSREDDYCWANATPEGQLTQSLEFLRISEGLTDYRYLLTLARLAKEKPGSGAAQEAERLMGKLMGGFRLGDVERDRSLPVSHWSDFRQQAGAAIEALR